MRQLSNHDFESNLECFRLLQERVRAKELAMRERETQELLKMGTAGMDKKKTQKFGKTMGHSKAFEQNVAAEKVQMYTQAFQKIQEATEIEEIDQLVHTFITAEDQNYTLFNYVNEVNTEIEKLEDQIAAIKNETDKYKSSGQEFSKSMGAQFTEAEESLAQAERMADLYDRRYQQAINCVGILKSKLYDIFVKIGCDTPAVRELLGDEGVTDHNMMSFLGIIEQRTNELLQLNALKKAGEVSESAMEALLAQPLTQLSSRIIIEPPSTTQEEEIEGVEQEVMDDDKPLSRDALETRVNKTLPYKLETAIKVRPPGAEATTKKMAGRR